ncbi:MAG: SdpI family protein [Oscillospiraceae bacterium]|nr:SdpI family protein [Oscillospiraceae bacterium]
MGFWIFMLIMNLLIPITMIGFGSFFIKKAPKKINMAFGYRTSMSMKNNDTWKFAHTYCGKLWRIIGWVMLPVSICAMLLVIEKEVGTVGIFGGVIALIQCVFLVVPIIPTERALRKKFDEHGNRIV